MILLTAAVVINVFFTGFYLPTEFNTDYAGSLHKYACTYSVTYITENGKICLEARYPEILNMTNLNATLDSKFQVLCSYYNITNVICVTHLWMTRNN